MTTSIETSITFPTTTDRVFQMLLDHEYLEMKCAGADEPHFSVDDQGTETIVTITRAYSDIPESFKKFVGEHLELTEIQRWHEATGDKFIADVEIRVQEKPVRLSGTLTLTSINDGTKCTFLGELSVNIPIFGAMVEGLVRDQMVDIFEQEQATGLAWLRKHPSN